MTVSAWIVFGSIASLNVTATVVVVSTPTAFGFGVLLVMVGAVLSVAALAAPAPITDVAINDPVRNLRRNMATMLGVQAPRRPCCATCASRCQLLRQHRRRPVQVRIYTSGV